MLIAQQLLFGEVLPSQNHGIEVLCVQILADAIPNQLLDLLLSPVDVHPMKEHVNCHDQRLRSIQRLNLRAIRHLLRFQWSGWHVSERSDNLQKLGVYPFTELFSQVCERSWHVREQSRVARLSLQILHPLVDVLFDLAHELTFALYHVLKVCRERIVQLHAS